MTQPPSVVVFDVNETLSDMAPMAHRFADVGAPEHLAKLWFATLLRDGFALTAAGAQESFAVLAREGLRLLLPGSTSSSDVEHAVEHIMLGFTTLPVHPDVAQGVRALRAAGLRLVTLTNGATSVAEGLFDRADIRDEFERLLSVDDAGAWKPARAAYEYAARVCGTELGDMLLVAVHPWDIDGAARAGMQTGWLNRAGSAYPSYFTTATYTAASLTELAEQLSAQD
jgi:2-haloacid dehalogenase